MQAGKIDIPAACSICGAHLGSDRAETCGNRDCKSASRQLAMVLAAAERHGERSEPDMEVGDLQVALRVAWQAMTSAQRKRAFDELRTVWMRPWFVCGS